MYHVGRPSEFAYQTTREVTIHDEKGLLNPVELIIVSVVIINPLSGE
jgi:hypothetical protein